MLWKSGQRNRPGLGGQSSCGPWKRLRSAAWTKRRAGGGNWVRSRRAATFTHEAPDKAPALLTARAIAVPRLPRPSTFEFDATSATASPSNAVAIQSPTLLERNTFIAELSQQRLSFRLSNLLAPQSTSPPPSIASFGSVEDDEQTPKPGGQSRR